MFRSRVNLPSFDSSQSDRRNIRRNHRSYNRNTSIHTRKMNRKNSNLSNDSNIFVSIFAIATLILGMILLFKMTVFIIHLIFHIKPNSKYLINAPNPYLKNNPSNRESVYVNVQEETAILDRLSNLFSDESKHMKHWPISVQKDDSNFESIPHPADNILSLNVPKFFLEDMPIGEGKLLTRSITSMIGYYSNENGKQTNDPNSRTIFINMASYRNWQCRITIENIFKRASYPDRIRVGVVDQIEDGLDPSCNVPIHDCDDNPEQALCNYHDQIDVFEMEASLSVGPIFARHICNRLYRGEYYVLQIDTDTTFVSDWDVHLIQQHDDTNNEMAIITSHLSAMEKSVMDEEGNYLRSTRPIMCNANFDGMGHKRHLRHFSQPETLAAIKGSPQLEPYWSASFSFARGHFIMNVPYDRYLPMAFQGEEISMGLRAFTHGYDFYAPEFTVCLQSYSKDELDGGVKRFLEHADMYKGFEKSSMYRLLGIIQMNPEIDSFSWKQDEIYKYGLGQVRDPSTFFATFGIHIQVKRSERRLCDFVSSGQMHRMFTSALRLDGMGINYGKILYRYHELASMHE